MTTSSTGAQGHFTVGKELDSVSTALDTNELRNADLLEAQRGFLQSGTHTNTALISVQDSSPGPRRCTELEERVRSPGLSLRWTLKMLDDLLSSLTWTFATWSLQLLVKVKVVLKEALKEDRECTDGLAAMLVMMTHFKEADYTLFLLPDVTTTPADSEAQFSFPITTRLLVQGDTVWSANKWMLSIEDCAVIPHSPLMPDFTTALAVLFASFYVFNIIYQVEAATTLRFVQRDLSFLLLWNSTVEVMD
ncbi:uncharacterized protein LOC127650098 [Xyrauchen texanus]|uniref:uncharacterized protein LOC127650098 n=1 Tax=Xyrauchen texanus TaxID=154827 RepID=UPI002241F896|nr:uncharacterized protein LOC127650098 [Xyrauchen texanus]